MNFFYEECCKRVEFGLGLRHSQDCKLLPVIRVEAANVCNQMLANCRVGCLSFLFLVLLLLFLVVVLFLLFCCLFLCFLAWLQDVSRDVWFYPGLQPLDGLPYLPATAPVLKVVDNVRFIMDREGIPEARWKKEKNKFPGGKLGKQVFWLEYMASNFRHLAGYKDGTGTFCC